MSLDALTPEQLAEVLLLVCPTEFKYGPKHIPCAYCTQPVRREHGICYGHTHFFPQDLWAQENKIYCDFLHRGVQWTPHKQDINTDARLAAEWGDEVFDRLEEDEDEDPRAGAHIRTRSIRRGS